MLAVFDERETPKEFYATDEFAKMIRKADFTVCKYFRHGRIAAVKWGSGRGKYLSWVIPRDQTLSYRREGLLPIRRPDGYVQGN